MQYRFISVIVIIHDHTHQLYFYTWQATHVSRVLICFIPTRKGLWLDMCLSGTTPLHSVQIIHTIIR